MLCECSAVSVGRASLTFFAQLQGSDVALMGRGKLRWKLEDQLVATGFDSCVFGFEYQ